MANFTLRPMTVSERKYSYVQSPQIQGQTGNIGYLRGDFGSNGNWFYTTCLIPVHNGKVMSLSKTWTM